MVRYKMIENERMEDAPFVGCLLSAIDCKFNCGNCFNQNLKTMPTITRNHKEIVKEIKKNPFNKGIILAGLEWSLQPEELRLMVNEALENNLEVIIYTGLDKDSFDRQFPDLSELPIYIKYGRYDEKFKDDEYYCFGVKLATRNQEILRKGKSNAEKV